jgi:hypothetical protein
MGDTSASQAARELVRARWGAQRPRRLLAELLPRLSELPVSERQRLRQALEAAELRGSAA